MRQRSNFSAIKVITLQDDAPTAVRAANVKKFRGWVETARAEGKRVIVVSNLLTTSGVHKKIKRDLEGLDYDFNTKGLMLHADFQKWIQGAVAQSINR
jgi:collagenase-like PrtC family protease